MTTTPTAPTAGSPGRAVLPEEWLPVGRLAANLWQHQPWDGDVMRAFLFLAARQGVELTPAQATEALVDWCGEGGEHAHYAPTPGDVLDRVREIERRNRPALPPPPPPDDDQLWREEFDRWAEGQPAERVERIRAVGERLRQLPQGEEHARLRTELVTAYLERRGAALSRVADPRGVGLADQVRRAQAAPITASQIAQVEEMVRAGEEHLVPERYRHLVPGIKARVTPRERSSQAS
jgi:hypothetical protein